MNFEFTAEQERFRQEVRTFLDTELPPDWVGYLGGTTGDHVVDSSDGWQIFKDIARKLGNKGWLSLFWPKEYGGQSWPLVGYLVLVEEIARRGSPGYNPIAVKMLAPTLIDYGSEEQKERHLKPIARGEEFWCEGFSEPGAGSDLASLQTKAIKDGNHFILNGQKTWSTFANYSDWCCLLARTDPHSTRSRGLSFFLADLSTPGVSVRPVRNLAGEPSFCEIFFEDAKIPKENIVGKENEGWPVAQALLGYERTSIEFVAMVQSMIEDVVKYLKATSKTASIPSRHLLAKLAIDAEIGRLINYQVAWRHDKGMATDWYAAMAKLYSTELFKRAASAAMQLLGVYGQLDKRERIAPGQGWIEHMYLVSFGATIAAGTSEIQKNIIALRHLGLPRG
ncbi:MAG: acyl-CoA dehydrogenase family protein [Dehalococcoidia bacterium]|nr:acyl-CoA dehydrogenase family protein [Dehalococcoidia bacterium]